MLKITPNASGTASRLQWGVEILLTLVIALLLLKDSCSLRAQDIVEEALLRPVRAWFHVLELGAEVGRLGSESLKELSLCACREVP